MGDKVSALSSSGITFLRCYEKLNPKRYLGPHTGRKC